ncbi:MAG: FHA domain-containing protein [Terriglobia bacterium]
MQLSLEIKTGRLAGRVIPVPEGKAITVGRTPRSDLAIPQDTFLSGIHFALECNAAKGQVVDRRSANGTFLNGTRVSEAIVHDGDEIMAGKTLFLVRMVDTLEAPPLPAIPPAAPPAIPPVIPIDAAIDRVGPAVAALLPSERISPLEPPPVPPAPSLPALTPPALILGSWSFRRIPEGWVVDEGYGLHFTGPGAFPSEAVVREARLAGGVALESHIESEMALVREFVSQPEIKMAGEVTLAGAEEARGVVIRYKTDDGRRFWQRQVYARSGQLVGVLTITTLDIELPRIQPVFDAIVSAAVFREASNSVK